MPLLVAPWLSQSPTFPESVAYFKTFWNPAWHDILLKLILNPQLHKITLNKSFWVVSQEPHPSSMNNTLTDGFPYNWHETALKQKTISSTTNTHVFQSKIGVVLPLKCLTEMPFRSTLFVFIKVTGPGFNSTSPYTQYWPW